MRELRTIRRRVWRSQEDAGPLCAWGRCLADNVIANPGAGGATFRTDTIGGVDYPGTKITIGADGTDDGFVSSANPMPVTVGNTVTVASHAVTNAGTFPVQAAQSGTWNVGTVTTVTTVATVTSITNTVTVDSELPAAALLADNASTPTAPAVGSFAMVYDGTTWDMLRGTAADGALVNLGSNNDVTVTGTVTVNAGTNLNTSLLALEAGGNLAGAATSLAAMDDWDEGDRAKTNPIVGQAGVAGGSGTAGATTQRVVLATDVGLPAGTANIGDVDVATVPAPLSTTGGGTEATALRVTIATDSTGVVSIDDNGGSLTVDGTVAISGTVTVGSHAVTNAGTFVVQVDGTALTRLTDIETNTDSGAVVGNGAAATAQRVTLANDSTGIIATVGAVTAITNALPAGTNNIGDVDVLTLPALAAGTNNIGDVDVLSIAAGDNNIGNVDIVSVPAPLSTTGGGTEATAHRVTIASDSTGVLSVDDNGGSLTVDGTVAVSGTVTVGSHAVTNAGTFATQSSAATSGGVSVSRVISAATTNETEAKASAGQVYGWYCTNINASPRYLKIYDNTAAGTVIGTTTPAMTILIPGNTAGAGCSKDFPTGVPFTTGITYGLTTGVADNDTGAVAANEIVVHLFFK